MSEIGGYFQLELKNCNNILKYHSNSYLLNSGRHALEFILKGIDNIQTLYIPYLICEVILEPLKRLNIKYKFYEINERLEIKDLKIIESLKAEDYILYINYFGVMGKYIDSLISSFDKSKIIIDASQSLFYYNKNIEYIFYSPRKFLGIPDGGIAMINNENYDFKYKEIFKTLGTDSSYLRCEHLLARIDRGAEFGYKKFKQNSLELSVIELRSMSTLTKSLINSINFDFVKKRRKENFSFLHKELEEINQLRIDCKTETPLVYPLLYKSRLKEKLIKSKVFVATYWPNVLEWCSEKDVEFYLSDNIVNIPIDQRYNIDDMKIIIEIIKQ